MDPRYSAVLLAFGVVDAADAHVVLDDDQLRVRFGHWSLATPVRNLAGAQVAGPFSGPKVIGPHLSFADRGATFGSNAGVIGAARLALEHADRTHADRKPMVG